MEAVLKRPLPATFRLDPEFDFELFLEVREGAREVMRLRAELFARAACCFPLAIAFPTPVPQIAP
jgi:hypothetical protein